jgi:nitrogen PTS system EIIA component
MSSNDWDLMQLAAYLHTMPQQVQRLAEQGKIPARRVSGAWRFSEAEIHHWLEERIGIGTTQELAKLERVVEQPTARDPGAQEAIDWRLLCPIESIAVPLGSRTRNSVIRDMCELAAQSGRLWDVPTMVEAVEARESLHPTAQESGVALLHARRPQSTILADSVVALGLASHPIAFGGGSSTPTDIFFLIGSYDDRSHLRILARISRMLAHGLIDSLRGCQHPSEAQEVLVTCDEELAT